MSSSLRQKLKGVPGLHRLWRVGYERIYRQELHLLDKLVAFAPNSAGTERQRSDLALLDAYQFFDFAEQMLTASGRTLLPIELADDFAETAAEREAVTALGELFDRYRSDKATGHDYNKVYGAILARQGEVGSVFEVGLGTNNTDVVSNMSAGGSPGASLRAFRDFCPSALVYGADIDKRVLFEEERIKTFFVDQTDLGSFVSLGKSIPVGLDLVIDDGLHSPAANLAVLSFGMRHVRPRGWVVVEDIGVPAVPGWQLIGAAIADHWDCRLVSARGGYMFVARKRN